MIETGFKSHRGIRRDNNEDACFVMPREQVYIIADGVGGNNAGEMASRSAVSGVAEYVRANDIRAVSDADELNRYMRECIDEVNGEIIRAAREDPRRRGMATTMVICHIRGSQAFFVNIGDSRAYLFRGGELFQITEDHSYLNSLIRSGVISYEEAEDQSNSQQSHMITRALGASDTAEADYYATDVGPGDVIVLCTDGLYGEVSHDLMTKIIGETASMTELADRLVIEANRQGGNDNITVVCLKIIKGGNDE